MIILLLLAAVAVVYSFIEEDLYVLVSEGRSFEELDYARGEPYSFLMDPVQLQVFPNISQTKQADFIFTFQLFKDTGVVNDTLHETRWHNTSFIRIDFQEYFTELDNIGEVHAGDGVP